MKKCGDCDKLDRERCYPTAPPKFDCKITGQCHFLDDVCDVKEEMGKQDKPRLAEVLGVEVDEKFCIKTNTGIKVDYHVGSGGLLRRGIEMVQGDIVCWVINHPETIIRAPRLTEPEMAIMRAVGARWVSFDNTSIDETVMLWSDKPEKDGNGDFSSPISILATVTAELFPSVKPGECIGLKEAEV